MCSKKVAVVPPDFTRFNSKAGLLTQHCHEYYGKALVDIMPALGTHDPVPDHHRERMFGDVPAELFRVHDWRNDVVTIGHVDPEMVREVKGTHTGTPHKQGHHQIFTQMQRVDVARRCVLVVFDVCVVL